AGALLFPEMRPGYDLIAGNVQARDINAVPVLLASVQLLDGVNDAQHLIRAQRYLRQKGFDFDVVILAHGKQLANEVGDVLDRGQTGVRIVRSDTLDGS